MTTKKGKAIIGIALAAIMIASVFVAMVPTSARTTEGKIVTGDTIFAGENGLSFNNTNVVQLKGQTDGNAEGEVISIDPTNFYISEDAVEGVYDMTNSTGGDLGDITIKTPVITGNIYLAGTIDTIVGKSVPIGTQIKIRASPNFGGFIKDAGTDNWGQIKIKLYDPDGLVETTWVKNASATRIEEDNIEITDEWSTGTWKVTISSDKGTCNEVDVSSAGYEFTVRSEELSIAATEDEVGKGEDMYIKVNGNPSTYYYLLVTDVDTTKPPAIKDVGDVQRVSGDNLSAWIKTGSDGLAEVKISTIGADERTNKINVYYKFDEVPTWPNTTTPTTVYTGEISNPESKDDVKVKVVEATVVFDVPTKAIIGEDVDIKGAISAGSKVNVIVKDEKVVEVREPVDENDEFDVEWDTDGMTTGSYTIEVYIDFDKAEPAKDPNDLGSYTGIDPDGKTTIRLISPGLDATQPRNVVAEEDDYTLEGTATGVGDVDYALVGPKGWKKTNYGDIKDGLLLSRTSVSDDEFSEDETMTDGLDTGVWLAVILSPGRDGLYEATKEGSLSADDLEYIGIVPGKSQSQIAAIIESEITQAGSDDLMATLSFKVESGYVDLNPVEAVGVGEPLNLTGTTNREPGTSITITTFAGPTDLLALTEVEWTTADEGTFSATIDTSDAVEGTYTLEADDGDGHTDTVTVEIGAAAAPTATPAPTAAPATAAPTVPPTAAPATAAPATPTPTPEEPGFEAVFAIAGLLAVAYLVLRIKK